MLKILKRKARHTAAAGWERELGEPFVKVKSFSDGAITDLVVRQSADVDLLELEKQATSALADLHDRRRPALIGLAAAYGFGLVARSGLSAG